MKTTSVKPWELTPKGDYKRYVNSLFRRDINMRDAADRRYQKERAAELAAELEKIAALYPLAEPLHDDREPATQCARALVLFADWLHAMDEAPCNGIPRTVDGRRDQSTFWAEDTEHEKQAYAAVAGAVLAILKPYFINPYCINSISVGGDCRGAALTFRSPTGNGRGWLASSGVWAV